MKQSLAELLSKFAGRIDDLQEQDGIRGYLKILKDLTDTDIIYVAKVIGRQASIVIGINEEENFDNFQYDLKNTPCDLASMGNICLFTDTVQEKFPNDKLLVEMDINGYMGIPLFGLDGSILGILVGLNHHKVPY